MGLSAADVSAVLITRGDVDLEPILAALPYEDVIVWDDRERGSLGCFSRYLAAQEAHHDVIYFQDDDLVFSAHAELLAHYRPGRITCNMPDPWYTRTGYDLLDCQLVGAGSLVDRGLWLPYFDRYLEQWPYDDLFRVYCDQVFGITAPGARYDWGYEILPQAYAPNSINLLPGAHDKKTLMQQRALQLRALLAAA